MASCKLGTVVRLVIGAVILLVIVCFYHMKKDESVAVLSPKVFFRLDEHLANISLVETKSFLRPDTITASFSSPILDEKGVIHKVKGMYADSKRLRHYYSNPKLKTDKFTIVMLSYNRTGNLRHIFRHYCTMSDIIDKLLIVWNNVGRPIPNTVASMPCGFPTVFLAQPRNSLNNRFIPFEEIETECVFSLDDDHLISKTSLQFGFNVWKSFPHHLVGFVPRTHKHKKGHYSYRHKPVVHGEMYSMVLTVAMFMNHKYLSMYTNDSPKEIKQFVDKYQNGEDISMVAVVSNYLQEIDQPQCACLWVREGMKEIKRRKKRKSKGLFHLPHHFEERTNCLNMLAELYGGLPIQYCSLEVLRIKS